MKEINVRLNANRAKAVHTGVKIASGDKGIVFKLAVDELDTAGTTAKIVFKRSNGTSVEAGIAATDGVYSYKTLGNEFAVVGQVVADVKFYKDDERISTCTFVFDVTADTMDGLGAGVAGYSDTLERLKKEMEKTEGEMAAVQREMEKRGAEIISQAQESADAAAESENAAQASEEACLGALEEVRQKTVKATFSVNFATGQLEYDAPAYVFTINKQNGNLEWGVR